jgi:hypothetical protein
MAMDSPANVVFGVVLAVLLMWLAGCFVLTLATRARRAAQPGAMDHLIATLASAFTNPRG